MRIEYLKEFIVLSEVRNFSVCANMMYTTQPSLSRHIQEIEAELGTPLFERAARSLYLTGTGEIFLSYARQIVKLQDEYTKEIEKHLRDANNILSIGTVHAIKQYGIDTILNHWAKSYPEVRMKITELDTSELLLSLRNGTMDMAFIREDYPDDNGDLERLHITEDKLVCLVPADNMLAERDSVSIAELSSQNIVYFEDCQLLKNLFLGAGFDPSEGLTGAKGRNALLQVKQGMGIMLYFRKPIDDSELGGFKIINIEPGVRSDINLVYRPGSLSDSGKLFVKMVEKMILDRPIVTF